MGERGAEKRLLTRGIVGLKACSPWRGKKDLLSSVSRVPLHDDRGWMGHSQKKQKKNP